MRKDEEDSVLRLIGCSDGRRFRGEETYVRRAWQGVRHTFMCRCYDSAQGIFFSLLFFGIILSQSEDQSINAEIYTCR